MVVIWGLNLRDMKWSAFKSSNMFGNTDFHLRRTKFVVYQAAMIFCVVSESLGTAVLSDYTDQQRRVQGGFPGIYLGNNDYVGIASYNIAVGVLVATVFGAGFFMDLFFPNRFEPKWVQIGWQLSAVFMCLNGLADALAYTVIISLRGEKVRGLNNLTPSQQTALQQELAREQNDSPLLYRHSARAIASVVTLWLGIVCTFAATYVMLAFYKHVRLMGTAKARHVTMNEKFSSASTGPIKSLQTSRSTSTRASPTTTHTTSPAAEQAAAAALGTSRSNSQRNSRQGSRPGSRSYTVGSPA